VKFFARYAATRSGGGGGNSNTNVCFSTFSFRNSFNKLNTSPREHISVGTDMHYVGVEIRTPNISFIHLKKDEI